MNPKDLTESLLQGARSMAAASSAAVPSIQSMIEGLRRHAAAYDLEAKEAAEKAAECRELADTAQRELDRLTKGGDK